VPGYGRPGGWIFNLMPLIDENVAALGSVPASNQLSLVQLMQSPLPVFNCPSRRSSELYPLQLPFDLLNVHDPPDEVAKSDYAINGGHIPVDVGPGPSSRDPADLAAYF